MLIVLLYIVLICIEFSSMDFYVLIVSRVWSSEDCKFASCLIFRGKGQERLPRIHHQCRVWILQKKGRMKMSRKLNILWLTTSKHPLKEKSGAQFGSSSALTQEAKFSRFSSFLCFLRHRKSLLAVLTTGSNFGKRLPKELHSNLFKILWQFSFSFFTDVPACLSILTFSQAEK